MAEGVERKKCVFLFGDLQTVDSQGQTMELNDLDNLNKSDFLPLLPQNIKQEEQLFEASQNEEETNIQCDSVVS